MGRRRTLKIGSPSVIFSFLIFYNSLMVILSIPVTFLDGKKEEFFDHKTLEFLRQVKCIFVSLSLEGHKSARTSEELFIKAR